MKLIKVARSVVVRSIFKYANDTRSNEFKEWFGDWEAENAYTSRNPNPIPSAAFKGGKPQTFYHGTMNDFDKFEVGLKGTNSHALGSWEVTRHALFFTPNEQDANAFTSSGERTGGHIKRVYLNTRSPLDLRNGIDEGHLEEFESVGLNPRWVANFDWGHLDDEDGAEFVKAARELGYDAIIFNDSNPETGDMMESWAVFDPSQVRIIK